MIVKTTVLVAVGLLAAMQFFRPERTNPPSDPDPYLVFFSTFHIGIPHQGLQSG
jgi:hypothetical protein